MGVVGSTLNLAVNPAAAITGINQLGISMGDIYKTAIKIGAAFVGWKITQATFSSMKSAEQQIIRLKTALQSATKGVETYREAVKFASATPFSVQSVIDASVALRVFQFDPFKETTKGGRKLIGVLGDMAGAMGVDVTEASHALTRAMVGEWEVMQNTFQISARTIPKLAGLRSGTKAYGDAIVEFLTKQKRFNGGMDETARSLSGMISNITDAIDIMFMGIAGVADSAEGVMKGLTLYDSVRDAFKGIYDAVSASNDVLDESGTIIKDGISQGEKLMRMGQGIGQVFKVVFDTVIKPFFDFFAWGVTKALNASEKFFAGFYNKSKTSMGLARKEVQIFTELTKIYMAKNPQALAQSIGKASAQTQVFLKKMGISVKSTNDEAMTAIQKSFLESKNVYEKGFLIFVIMMAIIGEVIKARVAKIIDYFAPLQEQTEVVGETVFQMMANRFKEGSNFVKGFMDGLLEWSNYFRASLSGALSAIDNFLNVLDDIFTLLFGESEGIGKTLGWIAGLVGGVIVDAFSFVLNIITAILRAIKILGVGVGVAIDFVRMLFNVFQAVYHVIQSMFTGDWSAPLEDAMDIGTAFFNLWIRIKQVFLDIVILVGNLVEIIMNVVDTVANVFAPMFGQKKETSWAKGISAWVSKEAEAGLGLDSQTNVLGITTDVAGVGKYTNRDKNAKEKEAEKIATQATGVTPTNLPINLNDPQGIKKGIKEQEKIDKKILEQQLKSDKGNFESLYKPLNKLSTDFDLAFGTAIESERNRRYPSNDIGEWNVPRDMTANIHRGEMIIPAQDSERIRSLFGGGDGSGNMKGKGSLLVDTMAQGSASRSYMNGLGGSGGGGGGGSYRNVTIHQNFYGKAGVGTAATSMKSSARDLVAKMDLM